MSIQKITDTEFEQALKDNPKTIVKFYADWCGSCKLFAPKYRRLSENEEYNDVAFLDVNAEENQTARKMAGVDNLPFFAIFENGELLEGSSTSKEDQVVLLLNKLKS